MKQQFEITIKDRRTGSVITINTPNMSLEVNEALAKSALNPENKLKLSQPTFKLSGMIVSIDQKHKIKKKAKKK